MRKNYFFIPLIMGLLTSCGEKKDTKTPTIRPVKVEVVESRSEIRKDFAGIVEAVDFVKLAFRVSGQIINIPIKEGQKVQKGQLIAEVDTREIALQYAADKSAFQTASAQLERNKRLLAKQAISVQEYEISESTYQKSKSAYELSDNNMKDARLYAPFSGSIEKKLAENFQRVSAGVPIVQLVNTNKLRIKFIIPDNYIYLIGAKDLGFRVEFDTYKGKIFKASLEEFLDMSADGLGIPVTITINDPKFDRNVYDVKPGFTCNVNFEANIMSFMPETMTIIPLAAVFQDPSDKQTYVWIVEKDNTVKRRAVELFSPTGENQMLISKGLQPGETIVIAGVYQLTEGETVKRL